MKIATTLIGLEEILKKDLDGKIICDGRVLFNGKKKSGSALIVYQSIKNFKFKNEDDIYNEISKLKFNFKGNFRVDCNKIGSHSFSSQDVREKVGEIIYNKGFKVDLGNPDNIIYVDIINNFCIIGINPENFGKRSYKIRINNDTLSAVLAYSLLKLAKFNKNKSLLDPFCSDGTILIEAALLNGKKLYGLCQDMKNASINSKIAKVKINLYKENLNWLDTLFKKDSLDLIISKPIYPSNTKSQNFVSKLTNELLRQSKYILKKNGMILLISPKTELIEKYAKIYNFNVKHELKILSGDQELKVLSLKKVI